MGRAVLPGLSFYAGRLNREKRRQSIQGLSSRHFGAPSSGDYFRKDRALGRRNKSRNFFNNLASRVRYGQSHGGRPQPGVMHFVFHHAPNNRHYIAGMFQQNSSSTLCYQVSSACFLRHGVSNYVGDNWNSAGQSLKSRQPSEL